MTTLTIGYSDSEDRLWVRIVDNDSNEARFWLTRRLVERMISAIAGLLEKSLSVINTSVPIVPAARLEMESTLAAEEPKVEAPEAPSNTDDVIITDAGLCGSINFRDHDSSWVLTWLCEKDKSFVTTMTRIEMHLLLKALLARQAECGWCISVPLWLSAGGV